MPVPSKLWLMAKGEFGQLRTNNASSNVNARRLWFMPQVSLVTEGPVLCHVLGLLYDLYRHANLRAETNSVMP
jgi:hypothetical protein